MNMDEYEKLPQAFYLGNNVVEIAKELLGMVIFTFIDDQLVAAKIVETEAYNGRNDKACHAYQKRTPRTEIMYGAGGKAYVYLCYGIHHLFNIVTNVEGMADAVLIRAVEPILGLDIMKRRRNTTALNKLTSGPGSLSVALGIKSHMTGADLKGDCIWIAKSKSVQTQFEIVVDVRIGVDYAGEDAFLPWRFYIKHNKYVSRIKKESPA